MSSPALPPRLLQKQDPIVPLFLLFLVLAPPPSVTRLGNQRRGSGTAVLEASLHGLHTPVVTGQPVNPGFDEDEPELGVLILTVLLQMFPDADRLLDQAAQVFREGRGQ